MNKIYLDFAMLDCKNYPSIQIYGGRGYGEGARSVHNEQVRQDAETEYLSRLIELQQEIRDKYVPQLIDDSDMDRGEDVRELRWNQTLPEGTYGVIYT